MKLRIDSQTELIRVDSKLWLHLNKTW